MIMIQLVLIAALQATPAPTPQDARPTTAPPAAAAPRETCRRERITGSNRTQRICTPVAPTPGESDEARDTVETLRRELPTAQPAGGPGR